MKLLFVVILCIGLASILPAQEIGFSETDEWVFREFNGFHKFGASILNLGLGLGSLTMGDYDGAFGIFAKQGMGLGFLAIGYLCWSFSPMNDKNDNYYGIFVTGVLVAGTIICGVAGVSSYLAGIIQGFRRPWVYKQPVKTARLDDINNWTVGFAPDSSGNLNGIIAFTAHF